MIKYVGDSFLPFHLQRLEYKESVGPDKDILKLDETSLMMIFTAMGLKIMETPSLIVLRTIRGYSNRSHYDVGGDKYIMIQCLFVTFLFIPALLPSPVQSCYDWIKRKVESRK